MKPIFDRDYPTLTLVPKKPIASECDGSVLRPSVMESMTREEIHQMPIVYDDRTVRLDELFDVIGDPCPHLRLEGDCSRIANLGSQLDRGTIQVIGNAGRGIATQMRGGRVEIVGNCGEDLATNMRQGTVVVHGSAGDRVAGPMIGGRRGMQGGDCIVLGNVGSRVAERMRRGILYIGGDAGDYGAANLIAGTIIVMGKIGAQWACGMRRGSLILAQVETREFAAELTPPREFELSFLPLIWRYLRQIVSDPNVAIPSTRWAMRQVGDRANSGFGEVLSLTRPSSR